MEAESGFGRRRVAGGVPEEEPPGGGRRAGVTTGFLGVPGAPLASLCLGENLSPTGTDWAHACRTLPPTLSFTQPISPTRFSPAVLRAVYVLPLWSPPPPPRGPVS